MITPRHLAIPVSLLMIGWSADSTWANGARRDMTGRVVGWTTNGSHAITFTSTRTKLEVAADSELPDSERDTLRETLTLVALDASRRTTPLCQSTVSGGCPAKLPRVLKAGYPALRGLKLAAAETYTLGTRDSELLEYEVRMASKGGTMTFSLAKGTAVIAVGSTLPLMTGSATVESLPQPHLTHQVIVFAVKEEEKDDGGYDVAQYEVPFRLVLPVTGSLARPARRPPAARSGH